MTETVISRLVAALLGGLLPVIIFGIGAAFGVSWGKSREWD